MKQQNNGTVTLEPQKILSDTRGDGTKSSNNNETQPKNPSKVLQRTASILKHNRGGGGGAQADNSFANNDDTATKRFVKFADKI